MRYLLIIVLLSSCGPAYHLKRAEKHVKKAIEKGAKVGADTTYTYRQLQVKGIKVEFTPKPIPTKPDTVYWESKGVKTQIIFRDNTVQPVVQCPDTVIQVKEKTVTKTVTAVQKSWLKWWYLLIALAVGLIVGVLKR